MKRKASGDAMAPLTPALRDHYVSVALGWLPRLDRQYFDDSDGEDDEGAAYQSSCADIGDASC